MHDVREIDPHDDESFRSWYSALVAGATADRTAPLLSTFEATAHSLRNPGANLRRVAVGAREGQKTVGAMLFEMPLVENLSTAMVEIDVPPSCRRRGVGTSLWDWATHRAAAAGRTIFQTEINVPTGESLQTWPGARFAQRLGFASQHVEDHLVLELPVDGGELNALEASVARPGGYELISWAGLCPEQHEQNYADMRTLMSRDVPIGDLTRDAAVWDVERMRANDARMAENYVTLVCMARTTAGEPVGYTLIFVSRTNLDHVSQDDTFVTRAHRGHNLGTLLKAANLRQLEQHRGERRWLHTWTAETNGAMRTVNARFGFQTLEKLYEMEKSP